MPEETATPTLEPVEEPQAAKPPPPKPRKEPQDHKPPAKAEVDGDDTLTITWEGYEITFGASADEWTVEAGLHLERGNVLNWLYLILGPARFGRLLQAWQKDHGEKMKGKDAAPLAEEILKACGYEGVGES